MRYGITKTIMSFDGFIDIEEEEYFQIKLARRNLLELLFIEEKFDYLMENYFDFENELLSIASRIMIFYDDDYYSMSDKRASINRRIVNLLTTCRMYLDQVEHHINKIYGNKSEILELIRKEKGLQFDNQLSYRIIEQLRDYVQHRGFPVQSVTFSHEVDGKFDESFQVLHTVIPVIKVSELEEDSKFKKAILAEMKQIGKEIDLRPIIREYIESIGKIHENFRKLIESDVIKWERIIDNTISKFQNKFGDQVSIAGLSIVIEENNRYTEIIYIIKESIQRRKQFEAKNRLFINLHKRYASNKIIK